MRKCHQYKFQSFEYYFAHPLLQECVLDPEQKEHQDPEIGGDKFLP
jgi:hypothetical protein